MAPGLARFVRARTEFVDATLLDGLQSGMRQVVIAGAGYDGRALRYRADGVTFFELDRPGTQADKRERLERLGVDVAGLVFVPVDFGRASLVDALAAAGHDPGEPSHFVCEGVSGYMSRDDVGRLVTAFSAVAAPGSSLVMDFFARPATITARANLRMTRIGTALMGEPVHTVVSPSEVETLLLAGGWRDVEVQPSPRRSIPAVFARAWRQRTT